MPSGPKKRKKAAAAAAKKREEEEMGIFHHPNATLPLQEDNEAEEQREMESHSSDVSIEFVQPKEEEPHPPPVVMGKSTEILLDGVEASEVADADVKDTCVSERPIEVLLEKVSMEASAAPLAEEKVEDSEAGAEISVVERSTEIILPKIPSEEESVEVSEVPVSVPADSDMSEGEEAGEMPYMGTIIESSIPAHATLLEHRSTIWNCCGLLDVFKSSQR